MHGWRAVGIYVAPDFCARTRLSTHQAFDLLDNIPIATYFFPAARFLSQNADMSIFLGEELSMSASISSPAVAVSRSQADRSRRPIHGLAHPRRTLACDLAARLAAALLEVPLETVIAVSRGTRRTSRARHVAIYLAHVSLGLPLAVVAEAFGRDRTTAAYACRQIEDARDLPAFDAALSTLEFTARVMLGLGHEGADV
jgi:hypothetical protein